MKIAPFKVELWMNEHEDKAIYNTGETCVDSISMDELFAIAGLNKQEVLNELTQKRLTYGHIFGNPKFKEGIASLYETIQAEDITTTWLVTAENSKGRFTLPDGSVVWLNADSRLAYSDRFTASGSRAVRLEGEAFFDVKRDTLRPFEVEMGKLRVKVLGTRFTASHMPAFNTEEVTLLSGKVEVSGYRADQSVVLTPDQSCSYDAGSGAVAVRNVAASNYCSWTGNSIIFDNKIGRAHV